MAEEKVKRKNLLNSLGNIKFSDWCKMTTKLGLLLTKPDSGTSHSCIRKPSQPIDYGIGGLILTINPGMGKQTNIKVFKQVLRYGLNNGISEDAIWKALDLL
ncbi:MAG: hypothetical protein COV08_03260 [Candidatus Vogelbacteria bacterium CG10_big_fil_rev_8_21_14_0_10_49_38]|uniref:Uncharacterized protein n=1 Tax=Candidatus Vogelbacteria bacterium CG10_big_fil_rev_8_21_14_0_10_49_38 TaxID=1975043 RepID=A0A2H0RGY8_9BACT|nr:MAG: hypothetical protein BK006_03260 [bacterium CG10_49_38]PIR45763.1 MAG: hypothetical protein COV08_03260 [Candidatus Vogelbacteria bacterium CG10_big_fil_rev_8_21_14_0_10_49_38]